MPKYDYRCTACKHEFEAEQSITESPLTQCPLCHKKVQRLISSRVGVTFKGSGFYVTDSKSKPKETCSKASTCSKKDCPKAA